LHRRAFTESEQALVKSLCAIQAADISGAASLRRRRAAGLGEERRFASRCLPFAAYRHGARQFAVACRFS